MLIIDFLSICTLDCGLFLCFPVFSIYEVFFWVIMIKLGFNICDNPVAKVISMLGTTNNSTFFLNLKYAYTNDSSTNCHKKITSFVKKLLQL